MEEIRIVIIHGGRKHQDSKLILEYLDEHPVIGMTLLCVGTEEIKNNLLNNENGINIKSIPSIVISNNLKGSEVYHGSIKNIEKIVSELHSIE